MAITVGDICTQFPQFNPKDIVKLVGSNKFDNFTKISLSKIAAYNGQYAKDLSIWAAKKEKENYTKFLTNNEQTKMNKQIGIDVNLNPKNQNKDDKNSTHIPMGISIFNINKSQLT